MTAYDCPHFPSIFLHLFFTEFLVDFIVITNIKLIISSINNIIIIIMMMLLQWWLSAYCSFRADITAILTSASAADDDDVKMWNALFHMLFAFTALLLDWMTDWRLKWVIVWLTTWIFLALAWTGSVNRNIWDYCCFKI